MALPKIVAPHESLARYLPEESYFSRLSKAVKPKAFMPPPNLKLSVFRIDGLTVEQVWRIGETLVLPAMPQRKVLYGIAEIKVSSVEKVKLAVEPDNVPPRHANIVGWPDEKEKRQLLAQELAADAKLIPKSG